jgi:hypothetical protein
MKIAHINKLNTVSNDENELLSTLVTLLTNEDEPLTVEEFMECCHENPPLIIQPKILYLMGIKWHKGLDGLIQNNVYAFYFFWYSASKNYLDAFYAAGMFSFWGQGTEKNYDVALICLLRYVETAKNTQVNTTIAEIYFEKSDYINALKYLNEHYNDANTTQEDKDKTFISIIRCHVMLKTSSHSIEHLKGFTWEIFWQFIIKYKESIKNDLHHTSSAILLFKFPSTHLHKQEAEELAIFMLKNMLISLYPLATNTIQLSVSMSHLAISSAKKTPDELGWTTKINNTLLDGYDKEAFAQETIALNEKINAYKEKIKEAYSKCLEASKNEPDDCKREELYEAYYRDSETILAKSKKAQSEDDESKLNTIENAAYSKEKTRQYHVHWRFFDPKRTHKLQTRTIANELQSRRLTSVAVAPLELDGVPARRVITAERSTVEASKDLLGLGCTLGTSRNQLGWLDKKSESVKLNGQDIIYYQNPGTYPNHLGNFLLETPDIGDYEKILSSLQKLTQSLTQPHKMNEQRLAAFMLRYAKTGDSTSLEELQSLNPDTTDVDVRKFNTICYHVFVKEIARRTPCKEDQYDFPSSIITARAVKLIEAGHLTLHDVFSYDAPCGVVTGKLLFKNHDKVQLKINHINRLYNELIYKPSYPELTIYFAEHPKADIIASRKQLRKELQETYGGNSDTDGEGYSSSEDDSPRKSFLA